LCFAKAIENAPKSNNITKYVDATEKALRQYNCYFISEGNRKDYTVRPATAIVEPVAKCKFVYQPNKRMNTDLKNAGVFFIPVMRSVMSQKGNNRAQ